MFKSLMGGLTLVAVVGLFAQGAQAERYVQLDAEVLSEILFGVRLSGELARTGIAWRECITPEGDTVYEFEGELSRGKLTITDRNQACFDYGETTSCFDVYRAGARLLLSGQDEFTVTRIETGVESCPLTKAIS